MDEVIYNFFSFNYHLRLTVLTLDKYQRTTLGKATEQKWGQKRE